MKSSASFSCWAWICLLLLSLSPVSAAESGGFRVPEGFVVTRYASDELAHDIFAMTTDTRGRVVVAGKNYIKILEDTDGDGVADKAIQFSDFPISGAHGLLFDGKSLLCVGDDGVWRFEDQDGDGVSDGAPVQVLKGIGSRGHSGNGLVRGPDGDYYLIGGNDAKLSDQHATLPGSPVKKPSMGGVVRFPKEGIGSEVLLHGLRNSYDLCFDRYGQMFTVDADGERILGLPYYAPNRLFDLAIGMHHGWGLEGWRHSWSRPDYLPDTVEWLDRVGRGSPTGMLAYRHNTFPERYQEGVFSVCWTFGRVYFFPLKESGSSYITEREVFMETTGDIGFAPVDMAVHPYGDVFVAIGGRGTEGGVFRVSYKGNESTPQSLMARKPLDRVLSAPQPYSAWSRADWLPLAKLQGKRAFERAALDTIRTPLERIRAVEILVDVFDGLTPSIGNKLLVDSSQRLGARAVWALGRRPSGERALLVLSDATKRKSLIIQRAAWEALAGWPEPYLQLSQNPDWAGAFEARDRRVRATAIVAAQGNGIFSMEEKLVPENLPRNLRARLAYLQVYGPESGPALKDGRDWQTFYWETCLAAFERNQYVSNQIDALRLMQLGLGDVKLIQGQPSVLDGLLAAKPDRLKGDLRKKVFEKLITFFPSGRGVVDVEAARVLAMLGEDDPRQLDDLTTALGTGRDVETLLFYVSVVAALPGERSEYVSEEVAEAVAQLHPRILQGNRDLGRVWNDRVADLFDTLMEKDQRLAAELVDAPGFELPGQVLFARRLPADLQTEAAQKIFNHIRNREKAGDDLWSADGTFVEFLGETKYEPALGVIRSFHDKGRFANATIRALVDYGKKEDADRIVQGFSSHDYDLITSVASGLVKMQVDGTPERILAAMKALRRAAQDKRHTEARKALDELLRKWTLQDPQIKDTGKPSDDYRPWFDWFHMAHKDLAQSLGGGSNKTETELRDAFSKVDWNSGNKEKGRMIYEQRACHACHSGNQRLGPSLKGIGGRMNPVDLFLHIADPDLSVSPAYQVSVVETSEGESHSGVLIYDSSVAILLQVSPEKTLRFTGSEVKQVSKSTKSLMPSGLLEGLEDQDLADLHAWLKGL